MRKFHLTHATVLLLLAKWLKPEADEALYDACRGNPMLYSQEQRCCNKLLPDAHVAAYGFKLIDAEDRHQKVMIGGHRRYIYVIGSLVQISIPRSTTSSSVTFSPSFQLFHCSRSPTR